MQSAVIILRLLKASSPRHWPGILGYFFARLLYRATGWKPFGSVVIRLKELCFHADIRGMSGLIFLDQILFQGIYEFEPLLKDPSVHVLFDVGANCGFYALSRCRRAEKLRAFCFEPHPVTFAKLQQNIDENSLAGRIVPVQAAVGSQSGVCRLKISEESSMGVVVGSSTALADAHGRLMPAREIEVRLLTLDQFAAETKISPDLIKVDVEGFEAEVLRGAGDCLSRARFAIVECDSEKTRAECESLLRAHNFQMDSRDSLLLAWKP
jgi:FkbM family methyltransferase